MVILIFLCTNLAGEVRSYPAPPAAKAIQYAQPAPAYGPVHVPSYTFSWAVKDDYTKNDFGQDETREADQTKGTYHVLLPDGRVQTVTYTVDAYSGYTADVTYDGEAQYPDTPAYKPYTPAPYQPAPYQPAAPKAAAAAPAPAAEAASAPEAAPAPEAAAPEAKEEEPAKEVVKAAPSAPAPYYRPQYSQPQPAPTVRKYTFRTLPNDASYYY